MQRRHDMPFGAQPAGAGAWRFRLWAPAAKRVELLLGDPAVPRSMQPDAHGWYELKTAAQEGMSYCYRIDGKHTVPDPAARAQRGDVHGPSVLVDPLAFDWDDDNWRGRPWEEAVVYELHVGCFTAPGTFAAAISQLDYLASLGVSAIELMPVADFPGARNWGYDGVLLFAPDRRYGAPDDLKRLVQAAHQRGLMVLLDVVYNHFGPEGNYLHRYAPPFFTEHHHTPWGAAINFDDADNRTVRDFYLHNALYWLEEYHLDGLRLDAVHAIFDDSRPDILEELADAVAQRRGERQVHLVLENDANAARYLAPRNGRRFYCAQWNDDFHHTLHVILTGEEGGYYTDFAATPYAQLARTLSEGFAFQGEYSRYRDHGRGERSAHLPVTAFLNFLQNHDQVGNRALGERIGALAPPEALHAATVLLLLSPAPPLLFMGQEWDSRQPFPFFCDFGEELAAKVREGRRREFARFLEFADPSARARIPDPGAVATFESAKLDWAAREGEHGRHWLALHRELLAIRRRLLMPRLAGITNETSQGAAFAETGIVARWDLGGGDVWLLVANLGAEPIADVVLPDGAPVYATPKARDANGLLAPWAALVFLCRAGKAQIAIGDTPVMA